MFGVWQSLGESLYFFRRHFFALARLLVPLALPVFLVSEYRVWWVLGGDEKRVSQDVTLLLANGLIGLYVLALTISYAVAELDGRRLPAQELMRRSLLAVPSLLALQLLMFLGLGMVFMLKSVPALIVLLLVPGLWLIACLMPTCVYIVAERQPVPVALQSSFRNFRAMGLQLLAAMVVVMLSLFLPLVAVASGLSALIAKLPQLPLRILLSGLVDTLALLLSQLWPILMVRYYDMQRQSGTPQP